MSYQRSAKLSQFIIHRGMIISFIQAIFTMIFFSVTIPIYNGYLILGYSTLYTSLPVFSLVLDEDVDRETCLKYPILYQTLQAGRSLNFKTFLIWVWKSIYQVSSTTPFKFLISVLDIGRHHHVSCRHTFQRFVRHYCVNHVYDANLHRVFECHARGHSHS